MDSMHRAGAVVWVTEISEYYFVGHGEPELVTLNNVDDTNEITILEESMS